jgi:hypothetical protein
MATEANAAIIQQRLFDVHRAAEYLRSIGATAATVGFIRGLITSAQVSHVRIGKKFYITREALDRWITTHDHRRRP